MEEGALVPEKQEDALSCHAPLISKDRGNIDFSMSACEIERLIRGLNPWPSAFTSYKGKQLKVWKASVEGAADGIMTLEYIVPGTVKEVTKDTIKVATGAGLLCIYELQLEGKKRMSTHDFLLGVKVQPGEVLGN